MAAELGGGVGQGIDDEWFLSVTVSRASGVHHGTLQSRLGSIIGGVSRWFLCTIDLRVGLFVFGRCVGEVAWTVSLIVCSIGNHHLFSFLSMSACFRELLLGCWSVGKYMKSWYGLMCFWGF